MINGYRTQELIAISQRGAKKELIDLLALMSDDAELEPMPKMYVEWNWEDVKKILPDEQQEFSKLLFDMD